MEDIYLKELKKALIPDYMKKRHVYIEEETVKHLGLIIEAAYAAGVVEGCGKAVEGSGE